VSPPPSPEFSPSQYPTTTSYPEEEKEEAETHDDVDIGSVEGEGDDDWSEDTLVEDTLMPTIKAQPDEIIAHIYSFIHDKHQTYAVLLKSCLSCRIMRFVFQPNTNNDIFMCVPAMYGNYDRLCKRFVCGRACFKAQPGPDFAKVLCYVHSNDV